MKVSVVIPVFNEEEYIESCLKSLEKQTQQADEILIIDNNCTDRTIKIAQKFDVKTIKEERQGMIAARNKGFDEAQYEIIARTDADCRPPTNWIKSIKSTFAERKIDALSGPIKIYDPFISKRLTETYVKILFKVSPLLAGQNLLYGPNFAITKNIWNKVKDLICLNDKDVHEDFDLALHIKDVGGKIYFDKKLVMQTSSRRARNNFVSLIGDYPKRLLNTMLTHNRLGKI